MNGEFGPRPRLVVAVHPQFWHEFGSSAEELVELINSCGYKALSMSGEPVKPTEFAEYLFLPR